MLFTKEGKPVTHFRDGTSLKEITQRAPDYVRAPLIEQKLPKHHHEGKMFRIEERARMK